MCKRVSLLLFILSIFVSLSSEEIRGIWVIRWEVDQPMKVFQMMKDLDKFDINTIYVQVYARCEAMYPSKIVPRSTELMNAPFGYDPLDLIIKQGHRNGYEVHAWINLYYAWSHAPFPLSEEHIINKHPEWIIGNEKGVSLRTFTVEEIKAMGLEGYFLEPGNPQVRDHLRKVAREIVENYDVDGLHMDYCRFPRDDYGYDIGARVNFMRETYVDPFKLLDHSEIREEFGSGAVFDVQQKWNDWRRNQVTLTVKQIYEDVKEIKPEIDVSVAVIGDNTYAREDLYQDWVYWANAGYTDYVVPMLYSSDVHWIERKTKDIIRNVGRDKLVVGLGAYLQDNSNLSQEIVTVQGLETRGYLLFSYGGMVEKGYFR
jgi:uncharacterized lipoprotein YddW (UPF0748 family)